MGLRRRRGEEGGVVTEFELLSVLGFSFGGGGKYLGLAKWQGRILDWTVRW